MIDVGEVIRTILLADAGVAAQAGTRVYAYQVPPSAVPNMPQKCVVIRPFGRPVNPLVPALEWKVTFTCFGAEPGFVQAWEVARSVYDALRIGGNELVAVTGGDAYYYRSDCENTGFAVREEQVNWPRVDIIFGFTFWENVG